MYLVDTNIFLEILLNNKNRAACEDFLNKNISNLFIPDFSLHSIGIVLFRDNKPGLFDRFIADIMPQIILLTIPTSHYFLITNGRTAYGLDFDDAYQYAVAKYQGLILVTQDGDFDYVTDIQIENIYWIDISEEWRRYDSYKEDDWRALIE